MLEEKPGKEVHRRPCSLNLKENEVPKEKESTKYQGEEERFENYDLTGYRTENRNSKGRVGEEDRTLLSRERT